MPEILRISFQDPDGFVFTFDNKFYRLVLATYSNDLILLKESGILDSSYLVKHQEVYFYSLPPEIQTWVNNEINPETFLTIFELDKIEFISYPWEWTIGMLQQAAEFTLDFQLHLVDKGLTLKDACFYNLQFINGKPVFIDLLSIKIAANNIFPWFPYGQFLHHFIFPLVVVKHRKLNSLQFLQAYPNGISKTEVIKYISWRSYFSAFELFHIHFLNRLNKDEKKEVKNFDMPGDKQKRQLKELLHFAASYVKKAYREGEHHSQAWGNYYEKDTSSDYTSQKIKVLTAYLEGHGEIRQALDVGANTGLYSGILINYVTNLLSIEMDSQCCEIIIEKMKSHALPFKQWQVICSNLAYPSPAIGWLNEERKSLIQRARSPLVIALAVVHHFYFSGSIDFDQITRFLNLICTDCLIVEFVNKDDEKVILLSERNDTRLSFYTIENFGASLEQFFILQKMEKVSATRTLFFLNKIG